ncbi:unnamed protein product, partial [Oppiella nova]
MSIQRPNQMSRLICGPQLILSHICVQMLKIIILCLMAPSVYVSPQFTPIQDYTHSHHNHSQNEIILQVIDRISRGYECTDIKRQVVLNEETL